MYYFCLSVRVQNTKCFPKAYLIFVRSSSVITRSLGIQLSFRTNLFVFYTLILFFFLPFLLFPIDLSCSNFLFLSFLWSDFDPTSVLRLSPFLLSPPTILGLDISYLEIDISSTFFLLLPFVFSIPWFLLYFEGYSTPLLTFSSAYSNYLFLS